MQIKGKEMEEKSPEACLSITSFKFLNYRQAVMTQPCNSDTWEVEAGGRSLRIIKPLRKEMLYYCVY